MWYLKSKSVSQIDRQRKEEKRKEKKMVEVQKLPLILVREYIKLLLFIRIGVNFREKRWILCDEHKCLASTLICLMNSRSLFALFFFCTHLFDTLAERTPYINQIKCAKMTGMRIWEKFNYVINYIDCVK